MVDLDLAPVVQVVGLMSEREDEFRKLLAASEAIGNILSPALKQLRELAKERDLPPGLVVDWGLTMILTQVYPMHVETNDVMGILQNLFESQRALIREHIATGRLPDDGICRPH